ncbi:MAG: protein-methionine-sulfoxide reductase heme-binding subunit MsrQ [Candidatus Acidiferrales bacterium]
MKSILTTKWIKVVVFLVCLIPLGQLLWRAFHNGLADFPNHMDFGANPIEFITHATGDWTIRFLIITLAVTPLRAALRLPDLIRFRRMLGLFAFFYACLHFSTWSVLDKFFDWPEMWKDVLKRRFITVGFAAFMLMIPLAVTSTARMIRRVGGRRWRLLHRLIYVSAVLGVIHYYWLVKSDERKPLQYAFLVGILLAWRLGAWFYARHQRVATHGTPPQPEPSTAEGA